jgi:ribonucleoside-diphosphate reductase alpha chain
MLRVMQKHALAVQPIDRRVVSEHMLSAAQTVWQEAFELGEQFGYRNAQATVLAPTGTISFMMDCDTTGIEPELALIKYKHLAGGGSIKIINNTVQQALQHLGYSDEQQQRILEYLRAEETIEGAPGLRRDDAAVFDCAFAPKNGKRVIHYMGHLNMMAAVQPFISGGISKTVNVPHSISPAEILDIYLKAWKMGIKAVAIYRDGSKQIQPLTTSEKKDKAEEFHPIRRRLPNERQAMTHKFSVGGHEGYVTVGLYEDGSPGELFIVMSKEGSTISGLMDGLATSVSLALQYGVPLEVLVNKFAHTRFEPSGFTGNRDIPMAKSILDYIFRWLAIKFLKPEDRPSVLPLPQPALNGSAHAEAEPGESPRETEDERQLKLWVAQNEHQVFQSQSDAPPCNICGELMVRNGSCYKCLNCGSTSGCS